MTFGQYLEKQIHRTTRQGLTLFGATFIVANLAPWPYNLAAMPLAVFVLMQHLDLSAFEQCPRCRRRLGPAVLEYAFALYTTRKGSRYRKRAEELMRCPHCALRLEGEIPSALHPRPAHQGQDQSEEGIGEVLGASDSSVGSAEHPEPPRASPPPGYSRGSSSQSPGRQPRERA